MCGWKTGHSVPNPTYGHYAYSVVMSHGTEREGQTLEVNVVALVGEKNTCARERNASQYINTYGILKVQYGKVEKPYIGK